MFDPQHPEQRDREAVNEPVSGFMARATGRRSAFLGVIGAAAGFSALVSGAAAEKRVDPAQTYKSTVGDTSDGAQTERRKRGRRGPTGPTGPNRKGRKGPTGPAGPTGSAATVTPGGPTGAVQINDGGSFDGDYRLFYDYANTGYIGINTGTPYAMLDVVGAVGTDALSIFKGASSQTGPLMVFKNSSDATLFHIDSDDPSNIYIGANTGDANIVNGPNEGINLIAFGKNALEANTTGANNVAIGVGALKSNTSGFRNVALGVGALQNLDSGSANMAIGNLTMGQLISGQGNTAVGDGALYNHLGDWCTAIGRNALNANTSGSANTAVGSGAATSITTGAGNTAIGKEALTGQTTGNNNTAIGQNTLQAGGAFDGNTAIGYGALYANTGNYSVAIGYNALNNAQGGGSNTAVGTGALSNVTTGDNNSALGKDAMTSVNTWSNATGIGYQAEVAGSNEVQLGNSLTTTYVYGTVQNRSDLRDKADVRDTVLGLDFINLLRPVDYRWDMRDDYRPAMPVRPSVDAPAEELAAYNSAMTEWSAASKLANLVHDGSKKRDRFHHGLIAQEVAGLIAESGIDFGGFQDRTVNGGEDVLSIGYDEFIAPMIKAIQELSAEVAALKAAK